MPVQAASPRASKNAAASFNPSRNIVVVTSRASAAAEAEATAARPVAAGITDLTGMALPEVLSSLQ